MIYLTKHGFFYDLNHDTIVFVMQQKLVGYLKQNYPHIAHTEYFLDCSAGQYKNFKNLLLPAKWNFLLQVQASLLVIGLVVQFKENKFIEV